MNHYIRQYVLLIIGVLIIISGFIAGALILVNDSSLNDRILLTDTSKAHYELNPGEYTLFYEFNSNSYDIGSIEVTKEDRINNIQEYIHLVVSKPKDNLELEVDADSSLSFTLNDIKGTSLYSFEVTEKDDYIIDTQTKFNTEQQLTFSIVKDFSEGLFKALKRVGTHLLVSIPFLLAGWFMFVREARKRRERTHILKK